MIDEDPSAHVTIVDRHGKPGGHWNDAYPFVTLHQPSSFYGVASMELGSGLKDPVGLNRGMAELASGPEVSGYFDRVMNHRLLASGRVSYHPLCNYLGDAEAAAKSINAFVLVIEWGGSLRWYREPKPTVLSTWMLPPLWVTMP